jgi:long-chain-fatty-acid--CoA ligase ACSBG
VRPSVFFGVPRVWEKMEEKLKEIGKTSTGLKKTIADWAKSKGMEHCEMLQFGNSGSTPWGYGLANAVVLSKVKEALGLDQCNGFFTAAAPINLSTLQYFASLDIPVHELFGQSECTGPHTSSKFGSWKMGYCGRPLPGTRTEVIPETGELTYTGRHIFMGYMYMPEKTAESFTKAGYLISGDVVEFDGNDDEAVPPPSGFMRITGRIKDIIITAGGENIPPILIEEAMKDAMPALSNVVVIGDKKKYLTMLISLKVEVDPDSGCPTDKLSSSALSVSADIGSTATTTGEAMKDEKWIAYINAGVQAANSKTASRAQFVQKWAFLPKDLSENAGEMTPTLKMKRNVINKLHADLINSMYA